MSARVYGWLFGFYLRALRVVALVQLSEIGLCAFRVLTLPVLWQARASQARHASNIKQFKIYRFVWLSLPLFPSTLAYVKGETVDRVHRRPIVLLYHATSVGH